MTDQKPDAGDPTESTDTPSVSPEPDADAAEATPEQTDTSDDAAQDAGPAAADDAGATAAGDADAATSTDETGATTDAEGEAEAQEDSTDAATPASTGAAWTTTPVAPDPEATEAALAALAAKPEVTLEPPETPPPPPPGVGGEPPDEGTPVLLVGGILVGAFVVALAIVLILFRPFDSPSDVETTLSPSPVVTEAPSAIPTAIPAVDTPNFQGLSLDEAELTAEDYGLFVRANPVETDDFDSGTVLDQEPSPGQAVEPGTTIELSVAVPVPTQPVPDVIDMTTEDAVDAIEAAGFEAGEIFGEYSDTFDAGNVISTDPEVASELPSGSIIDLVVSIGPETVPVPDIVDVPEADALIALDDADLVPGDRTEAHDAFITAGNVLSSDPAAASEVAPGSEVAYVVSIGPETVPVPDIVDVPEADALIALDDADLVPGDRTEAHDAFITAGNVLSSDPAAASEVAPGSEVAYVVSIGPETVPVPDIVDVPEADALIALDDADLVPGDRTEAHDAFITAGNVLSSDPAAASEVAPGSEVAYVVSIGPETVPVPDIVDVPEADALIALDDADLVPGDRTEAHDAFITAGNVLSSDPAAASEVAPGSEVAYVVSIGPETVPVPDIVDVPEADALIALDDADLVPGDRTEAHDAFITAGNVLSSDPAAASEVAPGSEVAYVVSIGPETVPVPDIVDVPEADALIALDDADLVPGDRTEAHDAFITAGNVLSSDPAAASEVAPGSEVAYVVSIGPETVPVPDIVDVPEADALIALDDADLVPGDRTEAHDAFITAGNVLSSDPAAASEVAPGSEVAYVVSIGPETVPVPDIVDVPEADALIALDDADLVPGDRTEAHDAFITAGNVLSSDPAAASEVAPGSEVAYVVSIGPETVPVPDIVDVPEADALIALDDADLVPGDRTEAHDAFITAGNVLSSDPAAASEVAPGSEVAYVVSIGPETVPVPDIVDVPEADALIALDDADLVPGDRTEAHDAFITAGNVLSSDPAAASEVAPGSEVAYVVSIGPETVPVPDIVDVPEADALIALDDADLVPGDRTEAHDAFITAGNVLSSDPAAASEVAPGSEVAYVVSIGPETVPVPDIVDVPEADALIALDDADLVPGDRTEAHDAFITAGNVLSSDPAAASEVAPGSEVAYVVSIGPETVPVPDIVDVPEADALIALDDADLVPGDRTEAHDAFITAGNVLSSDPAAASEVAPGSEVAYVVSIGPETVPVPDIVDVPEADALIALDDADLVPGDRTEAHDAFITAGNVLSSDPAAASEVAPGSEVAYVVSIGPETVPVPDIVDVPEADALIALDDADLVPGDRTEAHDAFITAGNVLSSDPAAASEVDIGSTVSYVISLGVEQVSVPDLSGAAADVEETLAAAGLVGSAAQTFSDSVPAGDVVSQDPSAGSEVDIGSTVSYVISLGVEQVSVPDLSGAAADVEETLAAAGLVGSAAQTFSDSVPAGDVVSQDPSAGSEVDIGSTVSYVISLGVEQVSVPDLSGAAADVEETLAAAGLVGSAAQTFSDSVPAGDVVSQDPSAGSEVDIGSTVSYVISLGVEQVSVPDLSGAAADVEETLAAAGLVGSAAQTFSDSVPAGDVVSQDPSAGSEVDIGSTVSYVISLGVEQVSVPDLSGAAADVEETLAAAGLVGSAAQTFSDSVPAGDVVSQDPSAGSEVDIGSTVSYVISLGVEQVSVPDLSGAAADVEETLAAAGLVGSAAQTFSDSVPAGDVVSQDPSAGSEVDIGSTVSYVISLGVEQVSVPDLSGAAADVEETLAAAGLVGSAAQTFSDSVPAGDVVSQDPSAGSEVDIGSTVSYVISLGVEQVSVPDLSGAAADVEETLAAAGLVGSAAQTFSDSVPAGDVVSQDPSAGSEVDIGSTVSYVISLGVEQVSVPDLSGAAADVEETLAAAGLVGSAAQTFSDSVPAGDVVSQDPSAGSEVDIGSTVSYVISLGVEQVSVPDLSGAAADVEETLAAAGLVGSAAQTFSDSVPAGDVVSQDPSAGSEVDIGSTVSYVISLGVEQVSVPDLSGAAADVEETLAAAGLVGSAAQTFSDSVPAGDVVSQDPSAGSEVDIGSTVSYVISLGVEQVSVPDLSGAAADVEETLAAAGLVGSAAQTFSDSVPAGDVVSQDPSAGSEVDIGSTVSYVISLGVEQVSVPDLSGAAADVEETLAAAGLVGSAAQTFSDSVPAGDVVSQDPSAGSEVDIGSTVSYVISLGVEQVSVPDLSGAAADVEETLAAAGLVGSAAQTFSDSVPAGDVVSQDPSAGSEVDIGSTVSYVISLGVEQVSVPDLSGAAADVEETLAAAGLVGSAAQTFSDSVPAGDVVSQDPSAGSEVDIGSTVSYVISLGVEQVSVPDLSGAAADVEETLAAAGLVGSAAQTFSDSVPAGDVVSQDPSAGSEVDIGSTVSYVISLGVTPNVIVPDVRELPAADAVAAIEAANLLVGETIEQTHEKVTAGDAIKTDPAADAEIEQGSPVTLFVSTGSMNRTIPDVKGQPAADAEAALAAEGLVVVTQEKTNANIAAGDAVKTDPAAGETVEAGSEVLLTISKGPKPVIVPDIVGQLQGAAKTAITDVGLTVGSSTTVDAAAPRNTVLSQDPAAAAEVPPGTAVDYTVSSGPSTATIPDVKGQPAADAEAALAAEGLVVVTQEKTNANIAAGDAVKTDPAAGETVEAGSEVLLTISKGPKPVIVPDIVGQLQGAAKTAITDVGLTVGSSTTVDAAAPRNTVLSQDPAAAAEVPPGTAVDYTVSSGPSTATIPDVKGQPAADAEAALAAEGLVVVTQEKTNANIAAGDAVKTDPAAGETVEAGSEVLLTISKGPKPVIVPDIVGQLQGAAKTAITDVGLTVGSSTTVDAAAPRNTVLSQDPAAAAEVPPGTAVDYTVSSGPSTATIPDVKGQPAADAEAALAAEGLVVVTQEKTNANIAAGDAVKTDPAAGETVEAGSEVLLTISKGPKPVIVPDIVGQLQGAAKTAITDVGLTVGSSTTVDAAAPRNTVLSQDPAAAAEVPPGTAVDYTVSSGPSTATIPDVKGQPAADAEAALAAEGLVVVTQEKTNANIAAGDAVKTDPAAGETVEAGSEVLLTISKGPKPETVPDITGLSEAEAIAALQAVNLDPGVRTEAIDETVPKGSVIDENPDDGTLVDRGTDIDYVVSLGPPIPSRGQGGSLDNATVISQLDAVAAVVPEIRELELGNTPYDGAGGGEQASLLAGRAEITYDPSTLSQEERALKRMGLLGESDDLAALLDALYGQRLPIGYLEQRGRQSVLSSIDKLNVSQRAEAAREFGRAAALQDFGSGAARVADPTEGDEARAALALELGDGTATMLDWTAANVTAGNQSKVNGVIVPGDDGVYDSMPLLLQREYSFPFLEGRLFVDRLRDNGGWDSVNDAWKALPESTEQVMHPKLYRSDRPTSIDMSAIAGRLGGGWKERWQQTMGELRMGVWLADGQPGSQQGPQAPIKLAKANAAAGWGGDRLVSLDGPDGSWAIVWQTKWDTPEDIGQFTKAADAAMADLAGAHAVLEADVSSGVSNPALVLLASDADTLAALADALGVTLEAPAS